MVVMIPALVARARRLRPHTPHPERSPHRVRVARRASIPMCCPIASATSDPTNPMAIPSRRYAVPTDRSSDRVERKHIERRHEATIAASRSRGALACPLPPDAPAVPGGATGDQPGRAPQRRRYD
jgi:hypothetical protein